MLGITGAFICVEGFVVGGVGGQIGISLVFHPDLGWAMFYYWGYLWGAMIAGGFSIVAGFWTWHGEEKFTFGDWLNWFFCFEATGGMILGANFLHFINEGSPLRISGWGVGMGVGFGGGVAGARAKFYRAKNWMIPHDLRGIIVPEE